MSFSSPRLFLLAGLWCCMASAVQLSARPGLLLRSPGYALLLNGRSNTEFAYSYPRRFSRQFTLEMWLDGYNYLWNYVIPISISHPRTLDFLNIGNYVVLLGTTVTDEQFWLPDVGWFHLALFVDLSFSRLRRALVHRWPTSPKCDGAVESRSFDSGRYR
eukprot:EG_transcript_24401